MIDIHCHLEYTQNPEEILKEAKEKGMEMVVGCALNLKEAENLLKWKEKFEILQISFGFHPEDTADIKEKDLERYISFIEERKNEVLAIGEIGLDYSYEKVEKEKQKEIFKIFLNLAQKLDLPVIIHCRQAFEDLLDILKEEKVKKVALHCFSGSEGVLKEAISRGYFISFSTNICYTKKHPRLAEKTPLEKILLETDAPWLDPDSQGKNFDNRPWKILYSAKKISEIKKLSLEDVLRITTENAKKFFT